MNNKPMLNAYPDSIGGNLKNATDMLSMPEFNNVFSSFYVLPSLYHSDLDRGFCVVDYDLNEHLATKSDLQMLERLRIDLKLDFVLNHASVQSPQFRDLLKNGNNSAYKDFFIEWNEFWKDCGEMTDDGYIQPDEKFLKEMFFRKAGLPILMVEFPDGKQVPYWNTFYQKVWTENGKKHYLGQMDLNINSQKVWNFYDKTLEKLSSYGAKIIRLDAFAYAPKSVGKRNFLNEPETWELLKHVNDLAQKYSLELLPEIHASYAEGTYKKIAAQGYMTYDFFLPGLLIDAIENKDVTYLKQWANEVYNNGIKTVNMLGCHDGIPLLDMKGLLPENRIQAMIGLIVKRGGHIKDLHGAKNIYYQVNATYYSALGESDEKLLLARAIQMFMPGKPQIWYLDLFAGKNDYAAVERTGENGHKEINRTNLTMEYIKDALKQNVVKKQLELIRFRNINPAFESNAQMTFETQGNEIKILWRNGTHTATLTANLMDFTYHYE